MTDRDPIRLGQFLKLVDVADTGGEARALLEDGAVRVNGEDEQRRGRQLRPGDEVAVDLPTGVRTFLVR
ncbi:RNA-binding S4 domain-containing protein [Cellulomonas massiliensis]|uniref:RNA-binding S4 domain-containing protein n=1 Tax=Cellulomonas massiliensis TaxID=1465811 RepID=UPI0002FCA286|nr:RNA-binding S4 domain-containing protein [Cellulomonas massiliensis]